MHLYGLVAEKVTLLQEIKVFAKGGHNDGMNRVCVLRWNDEIAVTMVWGILGVLCIHYAS